MFEISFHANGLAEETERWCLTLEQALRIGKLRLMNQESGQIAVREQGGSPEPVAVATKRAWKWTRDL